MRRVSIALAALVLVSLPVASKAQTIQTVAGGSPPSSGLGRRDRERRSSGARQGSNYYVVSSSLNQVSE